MLFCCENSRRIPSISVNGATELMKTFNWSLSILHVAVYEADFVRVSVVLTSCQYTRYKYLHAACSNVDRVFTMKLVESNTKGGKSSEFLPAYSFN